LPADGILSFARRKPKRWPSISINFGMTPVSAAPVDALICIASSIRLLT